MQHILLNICTDMKDSKAHIDIVGHFTNEKNSKWYNTTYKDCRVYFQHIYDRLM